MYFQVLLFIKKNKIFKLNVYPPILWSLHHTSADEMGVEFLCATPTIRDVKSQITREKKIKGQVVVFLCNLFPFVIYLYVITKKWDFISQSGLFP